MNITIRPEKTEDFDEILKLTHDAFMTLDFPGRRRMDEHYLLSLLQNSRDVIPGLRFAAELEGGLAGHIIYARTAFRRMDGTHAETVTFGPLSVRPEYQRRGVGRALVLHTLELARELGFHAVLITGIPDYYPKLGFKRAAEYGLAMADGSSPDAFMAYELTPGYLNGGGIFDTWPAEYDKAEKDDKGYRLFNAAYAKKHFPGRVVLRPLFAAHTALMQKWLYAPHVAEWYRYPEHWLEELRERYGRFSFITRFIAEYEGEPIGFCQYYDHCYAREHEVWNEGWRIPERKGEEYGIDCLIGESAFLQRGFGKAMTRLLLDRLRKSGAKAVTAQPERENLAGRRALESIGFEYNGEDYVYYLDA